MDNFTAVINGQVEQLTHWSGKPCKNLLDAREDTKRRLRDSTDNFAEVFRNNISKGTIEVLTRRSSCEPTSFTYTGCL